ncbi:hypothetical protein WG68_09630 [Arsukibacterium ikkense]|uniref:FAD dependent oxidoreductase domain-containing protein n=1 Tax=Arsukibacterium ikkense TaxID=336831 RepID=A0A0M2V472_9GAMM|nr:FAD-dependent oxidoreductase [Arsukibacterium ikkense]KKO45632.1 hypothetical protein WG68_09630 [Arsukibacterium ikkense]
MSQLIVVGAGIIGLSSAVFLQQAGFTVTLLDPAQPGTGCSFGNAGHFATEQVFGLAQPALLRQLPAMLLKADSPLSIRAGYLLQAMPWFIRFLANMAPHRRAAIQQALTALNRQSLPSWQLLLQHCQAQPLLQQQGALLVSEQPAARQLQAQYTAYQQAGIAVRLLPQAELLQLEPALSANIACGLEFTEVGHTANPFALCQQLFNTFRQQGGQYLPYKLLRIIPQGQQQRLQTDQGELCCDTLLIAAGAASHRLCHQLGWKVPLEAERGYHLMVNAVPLSRPVSSAERKFIMTPMHSGLRLAGTAEFAGLNATANYRRADMLQHHASALLTAPLAPLDSNSRWCGNRPSLPDSLPVLGACPRHQGIYYNFGHQHLGLTQAAFSAELISQCLQQQATAIDITPFRINRF